MKARLLASKAPFKILACGSGWSRFKGPGGDSWSAYLHERERLFDFIRDNRISGVVLLSGDTHFPYVACAPWLGAGRLRPLRPGQLGPGAGGRGVGHGPRPDRRPHGAGPDDPVPPLLGVNNAGVIDFDLSGPTPSLSFNVINIRGRALYKPLTLRADELVNGVSSWRGKQDR